MSEREQGEEEETYLDYVLKTQQDKPEWYRQELKKKLPQGLNIKRVESTSQTWELVDLGHKKVEGVISGLHLSKHRKYR